MKIKKICWGILVGVVLLVLCNGSVFAYKYEDEDSVPYAMDSDTTNSEYFFSITNPYKFNSLKVQKSGEKRDVTEFLKMWPYDWEQVYDESIGEWVEKNPPISINVNYLKVYSSNENVVKVTKEHNRIYLNYLSAGRTRLTVEYEFNGENYIVECWWDVEENEDTSKDNEKDLTIDANTENKEGITITNNTDKEKEFKNNNTNVETKIETSKQQSKQKNNNTNVETKTEIQTKPITNTNTNQNGNTIFNNTKTQNENHDFLLDSENKLVDAEYNNYTFYSEDELLNVDDSFTTNDEINEQKLAISEKTKSNTPSSKNTGIIIICMAVISVVIIAIIILIVKQSKDGAV